MKLFEITVLDDADTITYLKVSDKSIEELEKEIANENWSCFMCCTITEIKEVDGYKIIVSNKKD